MTEEHSESSNEVMDSVSSFKDVPGKWKTAERRFFGFDTDLLREDGTGEEEADLAEEQVAKIAASG